MCMVTRILSYIEIPSQLCFIIFANYLDSEYVSEVGVDLKL